MFSMPTERFGTMFSAEVPDSCEWFLDDLERGLSRPRLEKMERTLAILNLSHRPLPTNGL